MRIEYTERLRALAEHLPFELQDAGAANEAYVQWRETKTQKHKRTVDLWTYCYAQLYVLKRLTRDSAVSPGDLDALIEQVCSRLLKGMDSVKDPKRYTHWVNVVCRNTYLNGRRKTRVHSAINEEILPNEDASLFSSMDQEAIRSSVSTAISRLPAAIRDIAAMRLIELKPYDEIADLTDRPIATVRTYVAKAKSKLCEDSELRRIAADILPAADIYIEDDEVD